MSEKIRPQHVERKAILYVRQSSTYQVSHNPPCPATRKPGPKDAIFGSNARSLDRSLVDRQLMSQSNVLDS
jgi:hypothetical protein